MSHGKKNIRPGSTVAEGVVAEGVVAEHTPTSTEPRQAPTLVSDYHCELFCIQPADAELPERLERKLNTQYAAGYEFRGSMSVDVMESLLIFRRAAR